MKQKLSNLEGIVASLRPFLPEYLQEFGIDTTKNFSCLNPEHQDKTPSMSCRSRPEAAYCFSCLFTADIFTAAHVLEGKPLTGKGWIEENVLYLAKKYGVETKLDELSAEELLEYRTYKANALAAELISDRSFGDYTEVDKEIERRSWDKDKIASWGIGTVNYEEFREALKAAGFEQSFLASIDLDRPNLFNNHSLIFTVYDEDSRPVGFSAKNLRHNKEDKSTGPKYTNTRNTGLDCAIFKKGERLYGFNIAKDAKSPLYIFEGQANVITARHYSMANCCCTMGTALTEDHIALLKRYGCFSIVLIFDGDPAGQLAIQKVLDDKFSKERDFRIKLCSLPSGKDPDELIREDGFDSFVRLKKWTAFEWRLMKFTEVLNGDLEDERRREIAEGMIPIIASEKSHIRQEEMIKQVARLTGYETNTISSEVRRLRNEKDADAQARKVNVVESILSKVRFSPENIEIALAECQVAIDAINKKAASSGESTSVVSSVLSLKEADEAKTGEFSGFFMKRDGLGILASRLDDDWRSGNLVFIGGGAQAGKSSLCSQMSFEIADDPRNNAICIYHSIDDAMKYIVYKWICNASNGLDITLNMISNPNYWSQQPGFEHIKEIREQAYKKVIRMIQEEKLVIKDASDGPGLAYAESLIKLYRERHPDKNIVYFLDNFHKLPDHGEISGHERIKRLSNHLKNMTIMHRATIVSTVEYRKLQAGEKPSNVAIAECLEENTIIRDALSGERIKIKDINPGTVVHTIEEETLKIVNQKVLDKVYKGEQECYRIKLSNGMYIDATENHPLYRDIDGWQKVSDLASGDYIATAQNSNIANPTNELDEDLARFLGYLAGDGNYGTKKGNLPATSRFTNKNEEIAEDAMSIATRKFGNIKTPYDMHLGSKEIRFSQINHDGNNINPIKSWLKDCIGIWDQTGVNKKIPEIIFTSSNEAKASYLAGLFSTDGSITGDSNNNKKKKRSIRLFNTSKHLIYGAQSLLLDLGINSTISCSNKKRKEKHKDMYILHVSACSVERFRTLLSLVGPKSDKLINMDICKKYTLRQDNLPMAFSYKLNKFLVETKHTVWFDLETSRYPIYKNKRIGREIYRQLKNKLPALPNDILKLSSDNIIWQKIVSITPIGKRKVYDLEIEGTHNFLANNIFCHNSRSLDYDATVIIHLYNELHLSGEGQATIMHYGDSGETLPRIWVKFGKNKVSGYEGREFMDLYPANAQFKPVDTEIAIKERKERIEFLKINKNVDF